MRLRVEHKTTFTYDFLVNEAYTELRLKPSSTGGQHCVSFNLSANPRGEMSDYRDRFGNVVQYFNVLPAHQQLTVIAESEIFTADRYADDTRELLPLDEFDYLQPTRYTPVTEEILRFAKSHQVKSDTEATVDHLTAQIFRNFTYEIGATTVHTTADQVLAMGRGVCQDFAHLLIACCRALGYPGRYVSGYLYDPARNEAGEASHAWADIFVPDRGWISVDPTHNRWQDAHYVRVAVGRDYADIPPTRGIYKGAAKEKLKVEVHVQSL